MLKALFKKLGKSKKGFTLIELLVVIAILGILAAILIPLVGGYISNSRTTAANADARTVYSAAATVVAQNPDITFSSYAATPDHPNKVMGLADLTPYIGTHTFSIESITFNSDGSPQTVTIKEDNGAGQQGTYSRTVS